MSAHMDSHEARRRLLRHGVLIVLVSLIEGGFVPIFTNPRMAVAAHVGGITTGLLTALFGLVWAELRLGTGAQRALFWLGVYQAWSQTAGLILAAAFGTSRTTPLAGAGHAGAPWQEAVVAVLLTTGAIAVLACCALVVHGLRRPAADNRRAGF
jgi:hydroxylaminobenzene mutase